jgi:hypothetical protein
MPPRKKSKFGSFDVIDPPAENQIHEVVQIQPPAAGEAEIPVPYIMSHNNNTNNNHIDPLDPRSVLDYHKCRASTTAAALAANANMRPSHHRPTIYCYKEYPKLRSSRPFCKMPGCNRRINQFCKDCNIPLCMEAREGSNCFERFHVMNGLY